MKISTEARGSYHIGLSTTSNASGYAATKQRSVHRWQELQFSSPEILVDSRSSHRERFPLRRSPYPMSQVVERFRTSRFALAFSFTRSRPIRLIMVRASSKLMPYFLAK
jgi:hypothetical protein